jgi:Rieske Fe-S protein
MNNKPEDRTTQSVEPPGLESRRRFLDYLLGTSAVATLGAIVYPIIRFMSPPKVIESTESSVVAAKLNEVPVNTGKIFKFGSKPGIVVRTDSGELKAFSAVCTHLDCIVQYQPETKQIWCAKTSGVLRRVRWKNSR